MTNHPSCVDQFQSFTTTSAVEHAKAPLEKSQEAAAATTRLFMRASRENA